MKTDASLHINTSVIEPLDPNDDLPVASVFDIPDLAAYLQSVVPPRRIYHYTDPSGLLGIASSQTLWAGRPYDLNDRTEQLLIYKALDWQIDRILSGVVIGGDSTVLPDIDALKARRNEMEEPIPGERTIFTVSLTEEDDSLGQWRAYCPRSGGVALGFSGDALRALGREQGFYLGAVSYGHPGEMQWLVDTVLVHATNLIYGPKAERYTPEPCEQDDFSERFATLTFRYLSLIAPLIKHPSFKSEREWRLICESPVTDRLLARPSSTGLKQFLTFDLATGGVSRLGEVECVIGPNIDPAAMESAALPVLEKNFSSVSIRRTSSPYR